MEFPKPTKKDRLSEDNAEKDAIRQYRHRNVQIAIYRDNNQCVFCWFLLRKTTRRQEVHHVFSRGVSENDWREHYTNLLCTCKKHHPMAIQTPGASQTLGWVEDILCQANQTPINTKFRHSDYSPPEGRKSPCTDR